MRTAAAQVPSDPQHAACRKYLSRLADTPARITDFRLELIK
jgi:hypothetical protein